MTPVNSIVKGLRPTPRGFVAPFFIDSKLIEEYYSKKCNRDFNNGRWDYRKSVLITAKKHFGKMDQWLIHQLNYQTLCDRRYDFIIDTLNYIGGKPRRISPTNWYDLLEDHPSLGEGNSNKTMKKKLLSYEFIHHTPTALSLWCQNEQGFDDLLSTLRIIFGYPKKP